MRLFVCGDVMTGRGIDQILPHPGDAKLHESYVHSAQGYVSLAEEVSGAIPRPAPFNYIWGDALAELDREAPDARLVNLETSVTARGRPEPKGINYRMNPANVGCLSAAKIDYCGLANNHVLDWGMDGLADTLATLTDAGIASAGAGTDEEAAARPAMLPGKDGRHLLVFAFACSSAGIPSRWAAGAYRPGVNFLPDLGRAATKTVIREIQKWRSPDDLVVVSIHWGANWGYEVPADHRRFAHRLIDEAGVDVIHGHSSHHPIGIEVHNGRPLLYGCGDFINDYEGIRSHEDYRPSLVLAYLLDIDDSSRRLQALRMLPFRMRRFRLNRASGEEAAWLAERLTRQCQPFGHGVVLGSDGVLELGA